MENSINNETAPLDVVVAMLKEMFGDDLAAIVAHDEGDASPVQHSRLSLAWDNDVIAPFPEPATQTREVV